MRKQPLYSNSRRSPGQTAGERVQSDGSPAFEGTADARNSRGETPSHGRSAATPDAKGTATGFSGPPVRSGRRRERLGWAAAVLALALGLGWMQMHRPAASASLTQEDIDKAVLHTLATKTIPSQAARAYEAIGPSVVMVRGTHAAPTTGSAAAASGEPGQIERTVGSGVVILDTGTILTNLHVVEGSDKLTVTFFDGTESTAQIVSTQPENDLAVIQAHTLPDDLQAATLRSTGDLRPGDDVIAVGFPFGIGPSVSSGVVSGLKRSYRSPKDGKSLSNLIQFDAAANPGNSGGPLVTADGEVVGIVTAILNPGDARTFIGIGFAVPIENAAAGIGLSPF
ncbi:MAG: peptidase [Rhizobacter sp.]|nr:peptidase [Rhizobacter sp.]